MEAQTLLRSPKITSQHSSSHCWLQREVRNLSTKSASGRLRSPLPGLLYNRQKILGKHWCEPGRQRQGLLLLLLHKASCGAAARKKLTGVSNFGMNFFQSHFSWCQECKWWESWAGQLLMTVIGNHCWFVWMPVPGRGEHRLTSACFHMQTCFPWANAQTALGRRTCVRETNRPAL